MDQHILVSQLLSMTHEIDRAVRLADWEGAERLIGARAPYLESLEATQTPADLLTIREIQALDAGIAAETARAGEELQHEYRTSSERLNAAKQYNQAALRF